jgi:predicted lipid-binding transport protein (Tim44 family)
MQLRLEGAFPDGKTMTDFQFIYGEPEAAPETVRSVVATASTAQAQFRLTWDFLPGFGGRLAGGLASGVLITGLLITGLVALLVGVWLTPAGRRG